MSQTDKRAIVCMIINVISVLCFGLATMAFFCKLSSGLVIWEGWLTALYAVYVKDRYKIYCNRKDRIRCGCYENSK